MQTIKGARVSSRPSERKLALLDQGEALGHRYGCIHLRVRRVYEFNERTGAVTDFGIICGCTETVCHNCGQTRELVVDENHVRVDYDPVEADAFKALLRRVEELEGS